jgi:hypothetical protein
MAAKSPSALPRTNSRTPAESTSTPADASDRVSLQPSTVPAHAREDAIRTRAHALWDQAGRPDGDGVEYWLRAEQELDADVYTSG